MLDDNLKNESIDCCNSIYKKVFELRENIVDGINDNVNEYINDILKDAIELAKLHNLYKK